MENINLIRKLAWSFHHSTRLDYDDLFQEAALAYCEALKTYNPKKGKITTYTYWYITSRLKNYIKEESKMNSCLDPIDDIEIMQNTPETFWSALSDEAKQIADTIIENANLFSTKKLKTVEKKVVSLMINKNWSLEKIHSGFNNLKSAIS